MRAASTVERLSRLTANIERVVRGRPEAVRLVTVALVARGHVLLEDVPGVGKTTLAGALAGSIQGRFKRIQFTSDLLPADITGSSVWNPASGEFRFRPGPVFANIVLADELNRAMPRTQGAMLEAMNEAQATIDGESISLPNPFLVIATENPRDHAGTYPLPESQLDRFMFSIPVGYPPAAAERVIVQAVAGAELVAELEPVLELSEVLEMQASVAQVHASEPLVDYLLAILAASRTDPELRFGVSPRGGQVFLRAARGFALSAGRDHVVPEDLQTLAVPVLAHRVAVRNDFDPATTRSRAEAIVARLLDRVPIPA